MSNNVIYKNKGEVFKCTFDIDGAASGDVKVRLCLEFNDNKNMFFHGKIDKKGNCTVSIPKLNELEDKQGNLRIEAIIDDTYFNLYECPIEIKNSVQVKIKESSGSFLSNSNSSSGVRVQIGKLEKETEVEQEVEDEIEDENNFHEESAVKKVNPFKIVKNKNHQELKEEQEFHEKTVKSSNKFKSFQDYIAKKNK